MPKNTDLLNLGYKIVNEMKVTGVVFTYNEDEFINKNYRKTLINIDKMLNIWSQ